MATAQQSPDRFTSIDSAEALNILTLDTEEKPADHNKLKEQDFLTIGPLRDVTDQSGSLHSAGDHNFVYLRNACASKAQSVNYGGYDNTNSNLATYSPYIGAEGLDYGLPGICDESPSLAFHGSGYSPQMLHGPYAQVATQLPSVRGYGQLFSTQPFATSDPAYYQQSVSPTIPYIGSPTPVPEAKLPLNIDQQGESERFRPKSGYWPPLGSSGRGSKFSGNAGRLSFLQQGIEGFGFDGLWSDRSKPLNGHSSFVQLSSPAAFPKAIGSPGLFGNNFGMDSQQKGLIQGFGSPSGSYYRDYPHSGSDQNSGNGSVPSLSAGINGQSWPTLDEARLGGRGNDFLCSCTGTLDTLSERNRGPRASKPRSQAIDSSKSGTSTDTHSESYNQLNFVTNYEDAKFFVIKSYNEDNVHKSIKYGVWASTPNGNKKLDAAYREAKEKERACPIFLLFSVNASAQFCGIAEMVGPVDFDKSVDYWQQDKWTGHFPVKWHIIKDVPNSQFRHIILENNDNKPVTNSRDTQEVEVEQGTEMLIIFKNYETHLSILDDFHFYEERQTAMQERKARHTATVVATAVIGCSEQQNPIPLSNDYIKKMSKSFAEAVLLNENEKEHPAAGKVVSIIAASGATKGNMKKQSGQWHKTSHS